MWPQYPALTPAILGVLLVVLLLTPFPLQKAPVEPVVRSASSVPAPGPERPASASADAVGFVCLARAAATPPTSLGCNGYLPIPSARVFLSAWSGLSNSSPVAWPADPSTVPFTASSLSSANGSFELNCSGDQGWYVLWTPNSTNRVGGGFQSVYLNGSLVSADLVVYPYQPQGNASFLLPAYNNLTPYAFDADCYKCGAYHWGNGGIQIPNLAWTQDGVFYVNLTDRLVFYSFANRTVRDIAPWWPLYDNVMNYAGIENTEWLTTDGSWIYEFGCAAQCTPASILALYAVNITTGRTFSWNFTGITATNFTTNAQINLIGIGGNDSLASLIEDNGNVVGYDLWTGQEWSLGKLTYFEANNIEWVPQLDSYINVQAQGSSLDGISQWLLQGTGTGRHLTQVASLHYWTGHMPINGENWGGYNATSHEFIITSAYNFTVIGSFVFATSWSAYYRTFVMSGLLRSYVSQMYQAPIGETVVSSEHRSTILADGYLNGAESTTSFYNLSLHNDPFNGVYQDTNVSTSYHWWQKIGTAGAGYWYGESANVFPEGLFYNASYGLSAYSLMCRGPAPCTIEGGNGTPVGTVHWIWPLGSPEFPFPANAPLAQPTSPGPVRNVSFSSNGSELDIAWAPPGTGEYPLVNYTVGWGTTSVLDHWQNLYPQNLSTEIPGLLPGETIYVSIYASNLHGTGSPYPIVTQMPSAREYPVYFTESGLPSGTPWSVSLSGTLETVTGTIATFTLPNGTFGFSVPALSGYSAVPNSGSLTVKGTSTRVTISFFPRAPLLYNLTFTETGLPPRDNWSVSLSGVVAWSRNSSILFERPNGTYSFTVGPEWGYVASPSSGTTILNGSSYSLLQIVFTPVPELISLALSPSTANVRTNTSVTLSALPVCAPVVCGGNVTYAWSLSGSLGTLNASWGATVRFRAGFAPGDATISVLARVDGSSAAATGPIVVVSAGTVLSALSVSTPSTVLSAGSSALLQATVSCSPDPCPSTLSIGWSENNTLGTLRPNGLTAIFSSVAPYGSTSLTAVARLGSQSVAGTAILRMTSAGTASIDGVTSSPSLALVYTGGSLVLRAQSSCMPSPCGPGVQYSWVLNNSLGHLNSSQGSSVRFLAGPQVGLLLAEVEARLGTSSQVNVVTLKLLNQSTIVTPIGPGGLFGLPVASGEGLVLGVLILATTLSVLSIVRKRHTRPG